MLNITSDFIVGDTHNVRGGKGCMSLLFDSFWRNLNESLASLFASFALFVLSPSCIQVGGFLSNPFRCLDTSLVVLDVALLLTEVVNRG